MKVLLVEDDIVFSEILCEYLTDLNNEVILAFEGEKTEELIFSQPFDLILLDIHIPKNNGLTVLQKIRE
ncbi:MAG: response regulator, partial [Arcobacteraceae bacterium]|nr:response regulator [Arcobacteraceae bacterium]